jgi:uncharacterized membrane-anchored protein YitT (DUF2179 family)
VGLGVNLPLRQQLFSDEWEILQTFKSKNESICKSYSDEFIISSLWARKFDESRTLKLLQDNFQWRKDNGLEIIPSTQEIADIAKSMAPFFTVIPGARDKTGGGIFYSSYKKEMAFGKEPLSVTSLKKWVAWYYFVGIYNDGLDTLRQGMIVLQDLTEFGWIHFDLDVQKQLNLLHLFPLRVKRCVMYNPPVIFTAVSKIGKTFLPAKFMSRIETTNKLKDIVNYVAADQLWTKFGGDANHDCLNHTENLLDWAKKNEEHYRVPIRS